VVTPPNLLLLLLGVLHEGTSNVKSAKLFICKGKFEKFALLPNEELMDSFSPLNNIVNGLKDRLMFLRWIYLINFLGHCLLNMR
jgi:hypothetical protein